MARRRPVDRPKPGEGLPIMPRELLDKDGLSAAAFADLVKARRQWLADHGIDPRVWPEVYAVLLASHAAHGIPTADERARRHHGGDPREVLRPGFTYPTTDTEVS